MLNFFYDWFAHRFHKEREMFYIAGSHTDPAMKSARIVFPEPEYADMTHIEWFKAIGIYDKFDSIIRGYIIGDALHLYVGHDFHIPPISRVCYIVRDVLPLSVSQRIQYICLGARRSWWRTFIGIPWSCKKWMTIEDAKNLYNKL